MKNSLVLTLVQPGGAVFPSFGSLTVCKSKKCLRAKRPSPLGMTVQRDVISIVKISLSLPRKLKSRKIWSACNGKDLTIGATILSKNYWKNYWIEIIELKVSGPERSIKITDRFTCTSTNVIYCITCTLCKKLYIGKTGRRIGDRFREHLRDVEKDDKNASKPVARHFNLSNHSKQYMIVCGLSLHQGSTESRKTLEQKFIFQIGTLNPHGSNERLSFN